jgi:hypothetical protein
MLDDHSMPREISLVLRFLIHSILFPKACRAPYFIRLSTYSLSTSRTKFLAEIVQFVIMGDNSARKPLKLISQALEHGWSFRQTDSSENDWYPVQKIPSVVHLDLMQNNLYVQDQVQRGTT